MKFSIADSLFSLIIFIYVMVTFLYMFIVIITIIVVINIINLIDHDWRSSIITAQVTFLYMFYGFCWKEPEKTPPPPADPDVE